MLILKRLLFPTPIDPSLSIWSWTLQQELAGRVTSNRGIVFERSSILHFRMIDTSESRLVPFFLREDLTSEGSQQQLI